ncbi:peptidoglycan-binding protein [Sphingomonas bisphenolicum]
MTIISDDAFVRLAQERFGLKVDGVAGAATIAALGLKTTTRLPLRDDAAVRLFQGKHGLKVDGWAGLDTIARLDLVKPPIVAKADGSAIPESYWPMLSKIESADRPYVQASTSSASGLYQFIRSSWLAEGGSWGPTLRPAFGGLKPPPAEQLARAKSFTAKNAAYLRTRGVPINRASLYAAHFLGALTAGSILAADKAERADVIAGAAATAANPSILRDKTVADFIEWLRRKTGEVAR